MWRKIITGIVVVCLIVGLGVFGVVQSRNYVAKVAGEKIKVYEYKFFLNMKRLQMEYEAGGKVPDDFWKKKLDNGQDPVVVAKNGALELAKEYKIQLIKAEEERMKITKEVEDYVNKVVEKSNKSYIENDLGITLSQYKEILLNNELINSFALEYMKENRNAVTVSEDEVKAYYEKNRDNIDEVTVRHILFATVDLNSDKKEKLSEEEQEKKKKLAENVLERIRKGEDMAKLVKEYTDDKASIGTGGVYTFGRGKMVPEFENWAYKAKIGDTGIVKTSYGYHVMRLEGRTQYGDKKDIARSIAKREKLEKWYQEQLEKWKKDSKYKLVRNDKVFGKITIE